jgi:hypothetical protein
VKFALISCIIVILCSSCEQKFPTLYVQLGTPAAKLPRIDDSDAVSSHRNRKYYPNIAEFGVRGSESVIVGGLSGKVIECTWISEADDSLLYSHLVDSLTSIHGPASASGPRFRSSRDSIAMLAEGLDSEDFYEYRNVLSCRWKTTVSDKRVGIELGRVPRRFFTARLFIY